MTPLSALSWRMVAVIALGFSATGCRNPCQSLCVEMKAYAEECQLPVSDSDLDTCLDANKGKDARDDFGTCRDYGDPDTLREEWSCDDLADYWGGNGGENDTGASE